MKALAPIGSPWSRLSVLSSVWYTASGDRLLELVVISVIVGLWL